MTARHPRSVKTGRGEVTARRPVSFSVRGLRQVLETNNLTVRRYGHRYHYRQTQRGRGEETISREGSKFQGARKSRGSMERQKKTQKEWYENPPPPRGRDFIQEAGRVHVEQLKGLIPAYRANLSLNCGCGTGGQNNIFSKSIGTDISLHNVRSVAAAGGLGVVADMECLPFKDNAFDMVYGFGILHHLGDIQKGVSEAARVLKQGGYVAFGAENNGVCPFYYVMGLIYGNWRIERGFYRIRAGLLRKIFRKANLRDFKISYHGMTIYGLGRIIYRLTSLGERWLGQSSLLKPFLGYCYISGRKG
jgi:SAM-dependent methyltransferase